MPRPCKKDHDNLRPDRCHFCALVLTREDYRALWGESEPTPEERVRAKKPRVPLGGARKGRH